MGHLLRKAPDLIVILRALQLGDLLCTVPAFRALRTAFPQAHIALVGLPWAQAFVDRFSHYLDEFIEFPGWPGLPEQNPRIEQIPTFLKEMQGRHFDLALQMQGSGYHTNPLVTLFGALQSAGFYTPGQYQPEAGFFSPYPEGEHEIRIFLRLVESLGIPPQGEDLEFPVNEEERQAFEYFLTLYDLKPGRYICLHPGARFTGRRWPVDQFAAVGDALAKMGHPIVLTGSPAEREITRSVAHLMRLPVLNIAGQTDLGILAQLLANARLLISNDTGVSHMAAALKTPSVILFSASAPERWQPLNHELHWAVLNSNQASPTDVIAAAETLLREVNTYASPSS